MNHRTGRIVFALTVGLIVAYFSYRWIISPEGREERRLQISVVESSQALLRSVLEPEAIEIVDPLNPNRKVGKVYVYPEEGGWSVSGYYRRAENDRWHPFLMRLDADRNLSSLKIRDSSPRLLQQATNDVLLEVTP